MTFALACIQILLDFYSSLAFVPNLQLFRPFMPPTGGHGIVQPVSDHLHHTSRVEKREGTPRMDGTFVQTGRITRFSRINSRISRFILLFTRTSCPRSYPNLRLNSKHAFATSGAFRIADTTQTRFAPAAKTSSSVCKLMPPMANHGRFTPLCGAAAHRIYSSVTGFAIGFVPVA